LVVGRFFCHENIAFSKSFYIEAFDVLPDHPAGGESGRYAFNRAANSFMYDEILFIGSLSKVAFSFQNVSPTAPVNCKYSNACPDYSSMNTNKNPESIKQPIKSPTQRILKGN